MRCLENDGSVIIKPADKESSVVVWDRLDNLAEAGKELSDSNTYKEVKLSEKHRVKLVEKSNSMFEGLKKKAVVTERKINLSLILKRLVTLISYTFYTKYIRSSVMWPRRFVTTNCGTPTKEVLDFLDYHLQR